jgi:hypothetical protein
MVLLEGFTAAETIVAFGIVGVFFLALIGILALGAVIIWHRTTSWLHAQDDLWLDRAYLNKNK